MATIYFKSFDVVRVTSGGVWTPLTSTTLNVYNETVAPSTVVTTVSVDANGVVAHGTLTATVGDIIKFKHASYSGLFRLRAAATLSEAYEDIEYRSCTFVVENARTARTATAVDIWARDKNNPDTGRFYLGTGNVGDTGLEFAYQSTIDQDIELFPVPRLSKGRQTQADFDPDAVEEVAVTGVSAGGTGDVTGAASSTDNAIARWDGTSGTDIQNSVVTIADTTGIIAGTQGVNIAGSTSGAVNLRVPATAGSNTLTFPAGTTDFSSTGGSTQFVRQNTSGGAFTVGAIQGNDLTTNLKTFYLNGTYGHTNSGLAAAISAIGSTRAKLVVTEDLTVSTSQTIPVTCILSVENSAKITVSGGATLNIGRFADPGSVQCFSGVSASNHVYFPAANSLPNDTANIAWFGVTGDDMTYPVTDIFTSLSAQGGGALFAPVGNWKVNDITLPTNFIRVRGEAMGSDTGGSRFIPKDSGTSYLFRARNNYRNITFEHCALSVGTNTTTWPFLIDVDAGSSGFGCDFHHVTFHASGTSSYPLLGTETDSGAAEFVRASVHNCQFIVPNGSKGIFTDSINGQFTVQDTSFVIGSGDSYGIDFYRCGWVKIDNCDFRGPAGGAYTTPPATAFTSLTCSITSGSPNLTVTSGNLTESMLGQYFFRSGSVAGYLIDITSPTTGVLSANASASITSQTVTITKWATSTTRGGTCIKVGDISAATIVECQDEGFNYFLRVSGVGVDRPVVLLGNRIQDQIYLQDSASPIFMFGNFLYSNAWQDGSGVESQIHAFNTVLPQLCQNSAVSLTKSNNWGAEHAGSSVFRTDFSLKTGLFQQDFNYFTRIVEKSGGALTRPLLDILTTYDTSGSSQMLLRIGVAQATASGNPFKYGWTAERDTDTGYLKWKGTQDDPYNGWSTDFPIGYDSTVRGTVTQTTSRTTAVTCNYLHGIITCYSTGALPAGGSAIFQVNNTWVQNGDFVQAQIVSGADSELTQAWVSRVGGNLFKITIFNHSLTASETGTLKVAFTVVQKNGGVGGISY